MIRFVVLSAITLLATGCPDSAITTSPLNLSGPGDITFACYGSLQVNGEPIFTAQPIESCQSWAEGTPPPGQEDIGSASFYGFALQPSEGSIAMISFPSSGFTESLIAVEDANNLAPGKSSIPVGTLPVGLVTDDSGCFVSIANAGSCDIANLDVTSAVDQKQLANLTRVGLKDGAGTSVYAVPSAFEKKPGTGPIGQMCPQAAVGVGYVAFPHCHAVAAVELGTGQILDSVTFDAAGVATINGPNLSCHSTCEDGDIDLVPGAARPVTLSVNKNGDRLAIGAENSSLATVVDLSPGGGFSGVDQVLLEGSVGLRQVALTDVIAMGGDFGAIGGTAGDFQFIYGLATDGSIRVADVWLQNHECETQADPRELYQETDVARLSCLPIGSVARRVGANGPGIRVPYAATPTDVAVAEITRNVTPLIHPDNLVGNFAFVTLSNGLVATINIDDDNFKDFEVVGDEGEVSLNLAIAHQIRDSVPNRNFESFDADGDPICAQPDLIVAGGPMLAGFVSRGFSSSIVSEEKTHLLPALRDEKCVTGTTELPVSELSFMASVATRELSFPDWAALPAVQTWSLVWEGGLSQDAVGASVDGQPFRSGRLQNNGGNLELRDPTGSLCRTGVRPFDIVSVAGCDPAVGDGHCAIGETCFVAPESGLPTGVCIAEENVATLPSSCGEYFASNREFRVVGANADSLTLAPRREQLTTTPRGGCVSDQQCADLYTESRALAVDDHPGNLILPEPTQTFEYKCAADPTRASTNDTCQMTCSVDADCKVGAACEGGFCIQARIPANECLAGVQRYQLRASEAFVVIGTTDGYEHNIIKDPATGQCVPDANASPLLVSRIPLEAPPCVGDAIADYSVNPCSTTLPHSEALPAYLNNQCAQGSDDAFEVETRTEEVIRFQNKSMRLHLARGFTRGDGACNGDLAGIGDEYSAVYRGYALSFTVTNGLSPHISADESTLAVKVRQGPLGGMWVMDQGRQVIDFTNVQGQIVRFDPFDFSNTTRVLR